MRMTIENTLGIPILHDFTGSLEGIREQENLWMVFQSELKASKVNWKLTGKASIYDLSCHPDSLRHIKIQSAP